MELQSSTSSLFRPEVLTAQREQALGSALLVQPISTRVLTLLSVGVAAALIALAFTGEFTRKERVNGYLSPTQGVIKVYSRETGTIVEKRVVEGQQVSAGDVLFVISMERSSGETVAAQSAAMARLRERRTNLAGALGQQGSLNHLETLTLKQQIEAKQSELAQLGNERKTQELRLANAESTVERYRRLLAASLASELQVDDAQKDVLDQQAKLQELRRNEIGLGRDLEMLRTQVGTSTLTAQTQRAAIERDISTLEQELTEYESRRTLVVTAPSSGTATAVLADPGQTANPNQPLVSILPAGTALQAFLLVPSHAIGFLAVGQTVALRYEAFPYQRFGNHRGRVTEISRTLILPNETTSPTPLTESAYRVIVSLDSQSVSAYGQQFPLRSGMVVDASIWLERRKLYQWLLDPLYSVRGRV